MARSITDPDQGSDEAPASAGHNSEAEQQAFEARLLNLMAQHRHADSRIAAKRLELKEITTERKDVRRKLADAGYPNDIIDEVIHDATSRRINLREREALRERIRAVFNLPTVRHSEEQLELLKNTPDAVKTAQEWADEGQAAGLRGDSGDTPEFVPPENKPDWDGGWIKGQEKLAAALQAPKAPATIEHNGSTLTEVDQAAKAEAEAREAAERNDLTDEAGEVDQNKVDAQARRLKRQGFLKAGTSGGEPEKAVA